MLSFESVLLEQVVHQHAFCYFHLLKSAKLPAEVILGSCFQTTYLFCSETQTGLVLPFSLAVKQLSGVDGVRSWLLADCCNVDMRNVNLTATANYHSFE